MGKRQGENIDAASSTMRKCFFDIPHCQTNATKKTQQRNKQMQQKTNTTNKQANATKNKHNKQTSKHNKQKTNKRSMLGE